MPDTDVVDALLVRPSARAQLPTLLLLVLFFCAYPLLGAAGVIEVPLVVLGMIVFGVILLIGGAAVLRARHAQWELRLDSSGVTVRGHQPVPWTDLAEVRVTGLHPRWFFWCSFGYRVVSFIGKRGVELPALPSTSLKGSFERRAARTRGRRYGSRLIVLPFAMDASADVITESVRRWSNVPTR